MRYFLPVACLMAASPGVAWAQDGSTSDFEVGVFGGAHRIPDNHELFEDDDNPKPLREVNPVVGARFAYLASDHFALEAELAWIFGSVDEANDSVGILAPRAHVRLQYPALITPFAVVGGGALMAFSDDTAVGNNTDPMAYWGVGLRKRFTDIADFRIEGRQMIAPAAEPDDVSTRYEVIGGFDFTFSDPAPTVDSDRDGVDDHRDACPTVAGDKPDGCPTPDSDGDGLNDRIDECPDVGGLKAFDGCPDPDPDKDGVATDDDKCPDVAGDTGFDGCPNPDRDGDGVPNEDDTCPEVKGTEANGCPAADRDGDGVKDEDDECPLRPGDMENGCPDPDKDEDGIPLPADKCPEQKETVNGYQDGDGCPDEVPEAIKSFTGKIEGIRFASGSAELTADSLPVLDRAIAVLTKYPELRLRVGGHTDNTGVPVYNVHISQMRAEAVVTYMTENGVAKTRLEAKGYGPDQPIADNATSEGRAANRRIEFELIK